MRTTRTPAGRLMRAGRSFRRAAFVAALTAIAGCRELPDARAEALVRAYNQKVAEAYRMGDQRIVDDLVGDEEGKKLLGLIGVKADMGITLDATLTDFRVLGSHRSAKGGVDLLTEERWHYRDRRIGTGEIVGQESDDHYFLRYALRKSEKNWVVASIAFERPPEIGRTVVTNAADPRVFHGMTSSAPAPPGAASGGTGGR